MQPGQYGTIMTVRIADAHRDNGKRFVVHADELVTVFLELEQAIRPRAPGLVSYEIGLSNSICATEETPQGAANVQPAGRVGPNAAPMATLLFIYTIAVWRVLAR